MICAYGDDFFKRDTKQKHSMPEPHARKCVSVKCAGCGVVFTPPVAHTGIAIA